MMRSQASAPSASTLRCISSTISRAFAGRRAGALLNPEMRGAGDVESRKWAWREFPRRVGGVGQRSGVRRPAWPRHR